MPAFRTFLPRTQNIIPVLPLTTVVILMSATLSLAQSPYHQTGRWTQPTDLGADWGHRPIHKALLRGDATWPTSGYHSYVLSWHSDDASNPNECGTDWCGGVWGWNPPSSGDNLSAFPNGTFVKLSPQPS